MAYKVKGKFYWVIYPDPINNNGYCAVNFTSNGTMYNSINCFSVDYVIHYGDDFVGDSNAFIDEAYYTIDFGSDYQEINEWLYNLLTNKATVLDDGKLAKDIIINITSPEGITLATEKTIVNSNIKVTIDENLLNQGTDTTDATASAASIFEGETAYVAEGKVTGTFTIDNELTEQDNLIEEITSLVKTKASPSGDIADMTAIEEKYEELTGIQEDIYFVDIPEKMDDVYEAGKEYITKDIEVIEKTVNGVDAVCIGDISEIPHQVEIQLSNKNLINIDAMLNAALTKNGDEYTLTRTSSTYISDFGYIQNIPPNTSLTMSAEQIEYTGTHSTWLRIWVRYKDGSNTYAGLSTNETSANHKEISFVTKGEIQDIRLYNEQSNEIDSYVKFKNFQIEIGDTATIYAPYTYYPKEDEKNILDKDNIVLGGIAGASGNDWVTDTNVRTDYCKVEPNTKYYFGGGSLVWNRLHAYDSNKNWISMVSRWNASIGFTTPDNHRR